MTDDDRGAQSQPFEGEAGAPRSSHVPSRDTSRDTSGHDARPGEGDEERRHLGFGAELALLLGFALVLAVVVKALFLQAFYIPSGSMNDTLVLNDRILVQKVSYWGGGEPRRGDIVVFDDPGGWLSESLTPHAGNPVTRALEVVGLVPTGGHLVKRVIGVGGDRVRCCDAKGRIRINGVPLKERDYLAPGVKPSLVSFDQVVPDGFLWVMGDNRPESADSRAHLGDPGGGFVAVDDVVGKVFAVVWPFRHATTFHRPETFRGVGP